LDRKLLLKKLDLLVNDVEIANLDSEFSTTLGEAVYRLEWECYFAGAPKPPPRPPLSGPEAHSRLMDAREYFHTGQTLEFTLIDREPPTFNQTMLVSNYAAHQRNRSGSTRRDGRED
jgi:hypothetical protein